MIIIDEIQKNTEEYKALFTECSLYLEKFSKISMGTNLKKGVSAASNAVGKMIGNIPKIKNAQVDEFLIENGQQIILN